jgi:hypothetical protein
VDLRSLLTYLLKLHLYHQLLLQLPWTQKLSIHLELLKSPTLLMRSVQLTPPLMLTLLMISPEASTDPEAQQGDASMTHPLNHRRA